LSHSNNILAKLDSLKARLSWLDGRGENGVLSPIEMEELRDTTHEIHFLSRVNTSICWQQSLMLWLKEGDANTKKFHSILSSRRRQNSIVSFVENSNIVEGVQPIRSTIFSHFSNHFKKQYISRPGVRNMNFKTLSFVEGGSLVKPFSVEEVKVAMWDCDCFKSPRPDGVNFGFIKEFWLILKDDIMRYITEFHQNGKLARGINTTFIALIPKVESPQKFSDFKPIYLVGSL